MHDRVDTAAYDQGHISSAIAWKKLMADSGVGNDTTVILYGDNNNWFAAWALWQMKIYGHKDVRLMNGGRKKWLAEGRESRKLVRRFEAAVLLARTKLPHSVHEPS